MNTDEGEALLKKVINSSDVDYLGNICRSLYLKGEFKLVTEILLFVVQSGIKAGGVSLAFMIRRNEAKSENKLPTVEELLKKTLKEKNSFAVTNHVLYQIQSTDQDEKWREGDQLIKTIEKPKDIRDWWYNNVNDAEKELVIGWLVRHGLIADPDKLDFQERFNRARKGGWKVPDWMYLEPNKGDQALQAKSDKSTVSS